jgi:hypothetical protein
LPFFLPKLKSQSLPLSAQPIGVGVFLAGSLLEAAREEEVIEASSATADSLRLAAAISSAVGLKTLAAPPRPTVVVCSLALLISSHLSS